MNHDHGVEPNKAQMLPFEGLNENQGLNENEGSKIIMVMVNWVYIGLNTYSHFPHGLIEKWGTLETPTYHNILGDTIWDPSCHYNVENMRPLMWPIGKDFRGPLRKQ